MSSLDSKWMTHTRTAGALARVRQPNLRDNGAMKSKQTCSLGNPPQSQLKRPSHRFSPSLSRQVLPPHPPVHGIGSAAILGAMMSQAKDPPTGASQPRSKIQPLPHDTFSCICAGQVITDIASAVKELIENSIDANATAITVTLVDHGRKSFTVTDNGSGISPQDRPCMARRYYTSKLRTFADLDSVNSLGFRGEALHSLATLCQSLTITTRTASDKVAGMYSIDSKGEVIGSKVASSTQGTSVCATNLFHTLPVRRTTLLKKKENLKPLLHTYALAYPFIQFTLIDGTDRWVKPASKSLRDAIGTVHGRVVADGCLYLDLHAADYFPSTPNMAECTLTVVVPTVAALATDSKAFSNKPPLYTLNRRPIKPPRAISQAVKSHLERAGCRAAFHLIAITLPPGTFDINVDPAKSQVISECINELVQVLDRSLTGTYAPLSLQKQAQKATVATSSSALDAHQALDGDKDRPEEFMMDPPLTTTKPHDMDPAVVTAPPTPPRTSSSQVSLSSVSHHHHHHHHHQQQPLLVDPLPPPPTPLLTQPSPLPTSSSSLSALTSTPLLFRGHQHAIKPVSIHSLLTPRASSGPKHFQHPEPAASDALPTSDAMPSVHRISELVSDDNEEDDLIAAPPPHQPVLLSMPPASQDLRTHPPLSAFSNSVSGPSSRAVSATPGTWLTPSKTPRGEADKSKRTGSSFAPPSSSASPSSQTRGPRASQGPGTQQPTLFTFFGSKSRGEPRARPSRTVPEKEQVGDAGAMQEEEMLSPVRPSTSRLPDAQGETPMSRTQTHRDTPPPNNAGPPAVSVHLAAVRDHLLTCASVAELPRPHVSRKVVGPLVGERLQVVLVDEDMLWIDLRGEGGREASGVPVWSIANGPVGGSELD